MGVCRDSSVYDDEHLENGTPEADGWWTQGDSTVSCVVIN